MRREIWNKERQLAEVASIEQSMADLFAQVEGMFVVDNGYQPTALAQSRLRFTESVMWIKSYIQSDK